MIETELDNRFIESELVDACRVLDSAGQSVAVWGFVALRGPSEGGFWISGEGVGLGEIERSDVAHVTREGDVTQGATKPNVECAIAKSILDARPDVMGIVHTHALHTTAFATTTLPLRALSHEGCHLVPPDVVRFQGSSDFVFDTSLANELATSLGARNVLLLPGHGLVAVAQSLGEAVSMAIYLERSCRIQILAGGVIPGAADERVMSKREGQLNRPKLSWDYLRRTASRRQQTM